MFEVKCTGKNKNYGEKDEVRLLGDAHLLCALKNNYIEGNVKYVGKHFSKTEGGLRNLPRKSDFKYYVKKPIPIQAKQLDREFIVKTLEGDMKGNVGDYLIVGVEGEVYPCKKSIFEKTYQEVK